MIATEDMMRRFSPEFLKNEKPLEYIPADGGMVGVLRTIGCVGDSLSSGEFESTNLEGGKGYHDYFDYSWGQYMARMAGVTVRNFSRGRRNTAKPSHLRTISGTLSLSAARISLRWA